MSLIAHFPFNGNYINYGAGFVEATNKGSTWTDSYFGQAANFDGDTDYIQLTGQALFDCFKGGSNPFSICFWAYNGDGNSSAQSARAVFFGDYNTGNHINFNIEKTAAGLVRFYWNSSPDWSIPNTTLDTGWSHICLTYDGSALKCYINGELKNTRNGTLAAKSKTAGEYRIARDSRTGVTAWTGAMNDFRAYDHTLSIMEIQQLQNPLVRHYVFNDRTLEATTNLTVSCASGGRTTTDGVSITTTGANQDTYFYLNFSSALVQGTTYTISCDAEIPDGGVGTQWTFGMGSQSSTDPRFVIKNGHNEYTFVATANCAKTRVLFDDTSRIYNVSSVFKNFQVEQKDHATPFAGYNKSRTAGTTIYDVTNSGENLSLISTNAVQIGTDSHYGHAAAIFNGTQYYTGTSLPAACNGNCTVSMWVKWNTTSNSVVFVDYNTKTGLGLYQSGKSLIISASRSYPVYTIPTQFTYNQWNHICIVYKTTSTADVYVNGVKATSSGTNTWTHNTANLTLGARNNSSYNTFFNGRIADFRVYYGQLNEAAVLDLYARRAALDRNGNMYCAEYEEGSKDAPSLPDSQYVVSSQVLEEGTNVANIKKADYTININELMEGL